MITDQEVSLYTRKQLSNIYGLVEEIIDTLPDKALAELTNAYENDLDQLFVDLTRQVNFVINHNASKIDIESLQYQNEFRYHIDQQLKKHVLNYFTTTVLSNFDNHYRTLEWGNMVQKFPWSAYLCQRGSGKSYFYCYAFPLWRLYSYDPPQFLTKDTVDNKNRKETCLITNTFTLVKDHAKKIVEEIQRNPILSEKLVDKSSSLGKDQIITKTGSTLHLRSKDSMIRGLHVGSAITDDFLDKSAIYSKEQRDKFHEIFYAETKNIVEQGGYNIVSGTPFHIQDLYGDLKQDPMFKVFEYPGIFPNGDLLAPDRFSFKYLMDLKRSLGSIIFAREVLVTPVSDASSLFPWAWLEKSFIGMENVSFVDNISSYPFRMKKVVIGCDFAKSANIGADYTVFAVVGVDTNDNYHIIQLWRKQGASANEMVNKLVQMDQMFRPNKIVCEANGFQSLIPDMVKQRGLKNIEEFVTTGSNKKDLYSGLPSLSAIFERGEIKIPYSSKDDTRDLANIICGEFNSISFNEDTGKLESADQHDDCAMANFIAITTLRQNNKTTGVYYV